jgi:hypothetical protein
MSREVISGPVSHPRGAAEEVEALAGLLAGVVELAGERAVFPGRLQMIAELALGHQSVRRAVSRDDQR